MIQSVFRSYFVRQMENQFEIHDWDNLWSLLAVITIRKCTNVKIHWHRQGRDIRRELRVKPGAEDSAASWDALSGEPTPADAAALTDLIEHLLRPLPPRNRQIISLSLEGKSLREISAEVIRAERTVRRVLDEFRHSLLASMVEDGAEPE